MKIDVNSPAVPQLPADRSPKHVSNRALASTQNATEDRTTFSSDSLSVQSLAKQALNFPEIRLDKVDALRQSVNIGDYKLDATKIAGAIIDSDGR